MATKTYITRLPLHITDRDREILKVVCECKILAANQIQALIPGSAQQILRRLQKLTEHHYLIRHQQTSAHIPYLYQITKRASEVLADAYGVAPERIPVAFGSGLRPSEQNALTCEHIDFANKMILVRQGMVRRRQTTLKTKGSRREIDMLPMVEEILRNHREAAGGIGQYVFSNARGGPLFQEGMRRRIWGPTLERAGLRHRNHYQTRHTFATLMLSQGEEIAWVARMMGHTTTRMIVEPYYKFIPRRTRQDGDRFTKAFQDALTPQPSLDHT